MSKTPYEIRLDLLRLAKDSLFEPIYHKRQLMEMEWSAKRESEPDCPIPNMPAFPGTEEIILEAQKLNEFVSKG